MALAVFKESFSTEIKHSKYPTGEKKSGARKAKEGKGEKLKVKSRKPCYYNSKLQRCQPLEI